MNGTGESGLTRPLSSTRYFEDCEPDLIIGMFCQYFGVQEPSSIERCNQGKRRWIGHYYPYTKRITISHDYLGVVLHELAHHVVHIQNSPYIVPAQSSKRKVASHGSEFWSILQQMHDFMR